MYIQNISLALPVLSLIILIVLVVLMIKKDANINARLNDLDLVKEKNKELEKRLLELELRLVVRLEDRVCTLEKRGVNDEA